MTKAQLSKAQQAALGRICKPRPEHSPYWLYVKERTALSLIRLGLAKQIGQRIDRITCCTLVELIPTKKGREYSAAEEAL